MGRRVVTEKDVMVFKSHSLGAKAPEAPDDYKTKLIKYIPAEIVAAFVTVDGIVRSASQLSAQVYWLVFLALLALTPLYMWRVTTEAGKPAARAQIIVSTISFAVWVFALGGPFAGLAWYLPVYGALLLPIYTIAVPVIVGK